MYTKEQLQKLFNITNMVPVRVPKGSRGTSVKLPNFTATYLVDLNAGEAIALLTDKGNWYLVGEEAVVQQQSNKRIIEYRKTNKLTKSLKYLVKTVAVAYNKNTGELEILVSGNNKIFKEIENIDSIEIAYIVNKGDKKHDLAIVYRTTQQQYLLIKKDNIITTLLISFSTSDTSINSFLCYMGGTVFQAIQGEEYINTTIVDGVVIQYPPATFISEPGNNIIFGWRNIVFNYFTWTPEGSKEYMHSRTRHDVVYFDPIEQSYLQTASYTYVLDGTFLAQITTNGYILQQIHSNLTEVRTYRFAGDSFPQSTSIFNSVDTLTLKYNNKSIILNGGKFFVTITGGIPIDKESTSFTFQTRESQDLNLFQYYYDNDIYQPVNIINAAQYIGESILAGFLIDDKPYLIKGIVSSCSYVVNPVNRTGHFNIAVSILEKKRIPINFLLYTLILDNGSFWNYYGYKQALNGALYRGSLGSVYCDETVPFKFLNPVATALLSNIYPANFTTQIKPNNDSIVDNNIYSVINHTKDKAYIAKWAISETGNVLFDKILTVNYKNTIGSSYIFSEYDNSYYLR